MLLSQRAAIHREHYERRCDTGFDVMAKYPPINSGAFVGARAAFMMSKSASA